MPPRLSRAVDYLVLGIAGAFAALFLPLLGVAALGIFDAAPGGGSAAAAGGGYASGGDPAGDSPALAAAGDATVPLARGWHEGRELHYHDLGTRSPLDGERVSTAQIWLPIRGLDADGRMIRIEGQHTILDVLPGEDGYSDLWDIVFVLVPEGYRADELTSLAEIEASGYPTMDPGMLVNCPIVLADTTLEGAPALTQGWHRGEPAFYPHLGRTSDTAPPLYRFLRGYDEAGMPLLVGGQDAVLGAAPDDADYSGFWRLHDVLVGESFEPGSIRSVSELQAAGLRVVRTDLVLTAPVFDPDS